MTNVSNSLNWPEWNREDRLLIRTGWGTPNRCSVPEDARIFYANKVLSDFERAQCFDEKNRIQAKFRFHIKQSFRYQRVLKSNGFFFTNARKAKNCGEYLTDLAKRKGKSITLTVNDSFSNRSNEKFPLFSVAIDCAKQLKNLGGVLLLQGSQADGNTTHFSDFDFICFGDKSDSRQLDIIQSLNMQILNADPLQHHGVFFYDKNTLTRYSESILPLATLRCATAMFEPVSLKFNLLNDIYSPAVTLSSSVFGLKNFLENPRPRGLWDWKFKVSQFLIIPTLVAATRGCRVYKGDSFGLFKRLYSASAWEAIEKLTNVRAKWPACKNLNLAHYKTERLRCWGQVFHDPARVPDPIAIWKCGDFLQSASSFLDESLELVNLK